MLDYNVAKTTPNKASMTLSYQQGANPAICNYDNRRQDFIEYDRVAPCFDRG